MRDDEHKSPFSLSDRNPPFFTVREAFIGCAYRGAGEYLRSLGKTYAVFLLIYLILEWVPFETIFHYHTLCIYSAQLFLGHSSGRCRATLRPM